MRTIRHGMRWRQWWRRRRQWLNCAPLSSLSKVRPESRRRWLTQLHLAMAAGPSARSLYQPRSRKEMKDTSCFWSETSLRESLTMQSSTMQLAISHQPAEMKEYTEQARLEEQLWKEEMRRVAEAEDRLARLAARKEMDCAADYEERSSAVQTSHVTVPSDPGAHACRYPCGAGHDPGAHACRHPCGAGHA